MFSTKTIFRFGRGHKRSFLVYLNKNFCETDRRHFEVVPKPFQCSVFKSFLHSEISGRNFCDLPNIKMVLSQMRQAT
jgi:hypothetical protein